MSKNIERGKAMYPVKQIGETDKRGTRVLLDPIHKYLHRR